MEPLKERLQEWLKWDRNTHTLDEIQHLVNTAQHEELEKVLLKRMTFGTAGLRGVMRAGFSCMNDLVIIQTSQGLAKYVLDVFPDARDKGVIVSYDARHNSQRFAHLTAQAFLICKIPVYLFNHFTPTPYVPFSIVELAAVCGVMVTASHNPKEDNGYKVYWRNGAQIVPPHDKNIQKMIEKNLEPWDEAWQIEKIRENQLCKDPTVGIHTRYMSKLEDSLFNKSSNLKCTARFVYTAMHGVAHEYMKTALELCGFKFVFPVEEQMIPDPEFPTVRFPNPEEGKSALDLSIVTAKRTDSQYILANDPDADRLAVAQRLENSNEFRVFNGNEIGALLGFWCLTKFMAKNAKQDGNFELNKLYMIASTVSSKFLQKFAKSEGINFEETLTGFKWMANRGLELESQGKKVLFAFEEAIGYMCGTNVWDKDGVSAAINIAELVAYLGPAESLAQCLDRLYVTHGYHVSNNSYFLSHDQQKIKRMFQRIRSLNGANGYPTHIGKYKVQGVRDLTVGYDSTKPQNKPILPVSASSEMITFYMENGALITIRTSGTEPKVKWYSEIQTAPGTAKSEWPRFKQELDDLCECMVRELYQPEVNGFEPRPL